MVLAMTNVERALCVAVLVTAVGCKEPEGDAPPVASDTPDTPDTPPVDDDVVEVDAPEDRGPGRCVAANAAGDLLGVGEDDVPFVVSAAGVRTSLGVFEGWTTVGLVIDDAGVVSGYGESLQGRVALAWRDGSWRRLEGLGEGAVVVAGAADGVLAGFRHDAQGLRGIVREADGSLRALALPADKASAVYGLRGDRYVGIVETDRGATHPFVVEAGALVDLGTLGGTNATALGVNAAGDVVGASDRSDKAVHAFVRRAGAMAIEDLGRHPDATESNARGVDDAGRIVLNQLFEGGTSLPQVLRPDGTVVDLLPKAGGVPYVSAHVAAVSPAGIAVGWGVPKDGGEHPVRCLTWNLDAVGSP